MVKYESYELQNLTTRLSSGKNISSDKIQSTGNYPVFGGNGIRGYTSECNFNGECVIIGRQGAFCGNVRYYNGQAYMTEHAVVLCTNQKANARYLYYYLSLQNLGRLSGQSAQPGLSVKVLGKQQVQIPNIEYQQKIAKILSSLDEKIELNNKINENLHAQAQAIFKSWFVDFEPFGGTMPSDWEKGTLNDYIDIRRGGSPRPIKDFIVEKGINWLKIADVTSVTGPFVFETKEFIKEEGIKKSVLLNEDSLVLSNSATPGIPKILALSCCIHDGWLYFPNSKFSNEFLFLFFENIREKLILLGNGSVFTNLKTEILKSFPCILPKTNILEKFDKLVSPLFYAIKLKDLENQKLTQIRDTLLPKLMNGELEV